MNDDKSPLEKNLLHEKQILIDVVYTPLETKFIKLGNEVGALTLNGLDMFIEQGLASLDLWFGTSISKKVNFTQLKAYLGSQLC
jgi:shikimate dehydrogenase